MIELYLKNLSKDDGAFLEVLLIDENKVRLAVSERLYFGERCLDILQVNVFCNKQTVCVRIEGFWHQTNEDGYYETLAVYGLIEYNI